MNKRILCVDDDPRVLTAYRRNLELLFELHTAPGGEEGLRMLGVNGPYAVVVADMQMPRMNGLEFLMQVQQNAPETVRIMLTGNADQRTAADAVNQGNVYRFLSKPCPPEMLALALDAGVQQYHAAESERDLLENTLQGSVRVLTEILASVDPASFGRGELLRDGMRRVLWLMDRPVTWECEVAALLSQIGSVTVPGPVLAKARKGEALQPTERDMVVRIPAAGSNLLASIPRLEGVARILLYQQKGFDGSGFPHDGVSGEAIPIAARILKILTDLQDLESQGRPRTIALAELRRRKGRYDDRILGAACECFGEPQPVMASESDAPRAVSLAELRVGHLLRSDLVTRDGMLFAVAGSRMTAVLLEKIRNFARINSIQEPIWVC